MSYCHVLIHTARAIPILLVDRSLWRSIRTHIVGLTIDTCELAGRVGAVLLFPVAVPIVAILIVASLRREGWKQECPVSSVDIAWTQDAQRSLWARSSRCDTAHAVRREGKIVWRVPREPMSE